MYGYGFGYKNGLVVSGGGVAPFPNQYSLDFDGVNDKILVGDNTSFNFVHETGIFTMSYWIKLRDYTAASVIRISGNNGTSSANNGFEFDYNQIVSERRLRIRITVNPLVVILSQTTIDAITDNDWHNVIIEGDGTNVFFTIDGVTQTGSGTMSNLGVGDATYPLSIGSVNGYTPNPMNGNLDEVSIFNTNGLDKSAIYNGGTPTDLTSINPYLWLRNGDNGAYKSPQWLIPSNENKDKFSNYSYENYPISGNAINVGVVSLGVTNITSLWIKRQRVSTQEVLLGAAINPFNFYMFLGASNELYVRYGAAFIGWDSATAKAILNDTTNWINIVVVRSGNVVELFLNGASMGNGDIFSGTPGAAPTEIDTIGAVPTASSSTTAAYFNNVAAWVVDSVLPSDIYNGGVPPDLTTLPTAPVNWWKMADDATFVYTTSPNGSWTIPDSVGTNNGASTSVSSIFQRVGEAPNSDNNAVTINMDFVDVVLDTPPTP